MTNNSNIEKILDSIVPGSTKNKAEGICVICKEKVKHNEFKDELSRQEYNITGFCQSCQDEFYGNFDDDE